MKLILQYFSLLNSIIWINLIHFLKVEKITFSNKVQNMKIHPGKDYSPIDTPLMFYYFIAKSKVT